MDTSSPPTPSPLRSAADIVLRAVVVTTAAAAAGNRLGGGDPLSSGLASVLAVIGAAGLWALVDGWRRPASAATLSWVGASLLASVLGAVYAALAVGAGRPFDASTLPDRLLAHLVRGDLVWASLLVLVPAAGGIGLGQALAAHLRTRLRSGGRAARQEVGA
jgi:hypothetical protein